jgi:diadenosine tetraphosphatase ApaH/serine/threonine PP2A family protein phosphatase
MASAPSGARERLAILAGVYGNLHALDAVLGDIAARGIASAWCLGDLGAFGPDPEACITRLVERGIPTVQGNVDHSLGHRLRDCACGYTHADDLYFSQLSFDHSDARVSEASRAWLRGLPAEARLTFAGRRVLLCHGSPRRQNEFLWASSSSDAFLERLCETHGADVLVCAHTGLHWHRALDGIGHLVNVGAIGRPANDGRTEVWFTILNGAARRALDVEFVPVAYDYKALAREMAEESLPPEFIETILSGWWTSCLEVLPPKERARGRY